MISGIVVFKEKAPSESLLTVKGFEGEVLVVGVDVKFSSQKSSAKGGKRHDNCQEFLLKGGIVSKVVDFDL